MTVDLGSGTAGIVSFEGGPTFYTLEVRQRGEDDFSIRWESGWHKMYRRDGTCTSSGVITSTDGTETPTVGANCISFTPCSLDDPRAHGLRTEMIP